MQDLTPITNLSDPLTMSSKDIAELTGKRHDNILRDIEKMMGDLEANSAVPFTSNLRASLKSTTYKDSIGRECKMYFLDRELTLTLTSGYSVVQRHKIIKRWLELEAEKQAKLTPTEQLLISVQRMVEIEREQARQSDTIARVEARQEMMEKGFHDFSVLAYAGYRNLPKLDLAIATKLGKKAAKMCRERGEPIGKIRDPRFGQVNTYPEHILDELFQNEYDF